MNGNVLSHRKYGVQGVAFRTNDREENKIVHAFSLVFLDKMYFLKVK